VNRIFRPADILIPNNKNMNHWSVVACDQFTSDKNYWEDVERIVGEDVSTLKLMLPEAYLSSVDTEIETAKINAEMNKYVENDVFTEFEDSFIYIERTISSGAIRKGIIGALDLEYYSYAKDSETPIRATEGTVEDRLPPRVKVRQNAPLEMPHIMVFIDDESNEVINSAADGELIYDFELMKNGGHIKGYRVRDNLKVENAIEKLFDKQALSRKYHLDDYAPVIFAMGDGNHSLATAKKCWENIKSGLSDDEIENHPARFALVELVNIHDSSIVFEPIHKVILKTIPDKFLEYAKMYFADSEGEGHTITVVAGNKKEKISVSGFTIGELIATCEQLCQQYISVNYGFIDYIHGDDEAMELASTPGNCGILLPSMKKSELYPSVIKSGPFPKKSFSIGLGPDKRYYLECRRIK